MVFLPAGVALLIDTSGFRMLLLSFAFTNRCIVSEKTAFFIQNINSRFWNTLTGQPMQSVDTGSQVFSNNALSRLSLQSETGGVRSFTSCLRCVTSLGRNMQASWCQPTATVRTRSLSGSIQVLFRLSKNHSEVSSNFNSRLSGGQANRSQLQSSLPCNVSRWRGNCHRRW